MTTKQNVKNANMAALEEHIFIDPLKTSQTRILRLKFNKNNLILLPYKESKSFWLFIRESLESRIEEEFYRFREYSERAETIMKKLL